MIIDVLADLYKRNIKVVLKNGFKYEGIVTSCDDFAHIITIKDWKDGETDIDVGAIAALSIIPDVK